MNEYSILEQIQNETDINALKNLFIRTINQYETQLTEIHEANSTQIDLLNQRLSESNAANKSLKDKIKKMKELNDSDFDSLRENERQLQELLLTTQKENNELRLQLENKENVNEFTNNKSGFIAIQEKNANLVEQLARSKEDYADLYDSFLFVKESLAKISKSNRNLRSIVASFIESASQSLALAHHASNHSCQFALSAEQKYKTIYKGLGTIKLQIQRLKQANSTIPKINLRAFKVRLSRKFNQILATEMLRQRTDYSIRERKITANTQFSAEAALGLTTAMKLLSVSTSSSFSLFHKYFIKNLQELKKACTHFVSTFQINLDTRQLKYQKKLKEKELEIRNLKTENSLLKTSQEMTKQKMRTLIENSQEISIYTNSALKKRISSRNSKKSVTNRTADTSSTITNISEIKPNQKTELVDVETQSGLINMALIRDRTIRHSTEAQLSAAKAELDRSKEQNQKLLEQIGGLRKIIRRAGESAFEETGKTRQTIEDLETQLREEKRNVQRKTSQYLKLQRDNEELAQVAAKVDPLKKVIALIFKNCSDRLIPLLDEKSISNELIELDELAQEFLNVPIRTICGPSYSRGFLKKQERKLNSAIANSIEVDEITKVFESMINEIQKLSK
ncbi:hypothetical protein M9Y10_036173 [Tritrichomonas musculus]|uniref:Uncharacterized protein n=1 Tax=Tritrichomonas musculus TaxID=1915356 RepID=A0ABR2GUU0_9EUKA